MQSHIGPFLTRLGLFPAYGRRSKVLIQGGTGTWTRQQAILQSRTCCRHGSCFDHHGDFTVWPNQGFATGVVTPLILANVDVGVLFLFAVSSLGVYGIVLGAWASNNKYSFMGGIRSSAQMISYELTLGLAVLPVLMWESAGI